MWESGKRLSRVVEAECAKRYAGACGRRPHALNEAPHVLPLWKEQKKMITVRLAGGLGNQLFQLAMALRVRKTGAQIRLLTGALGRYESVREPDLLRLVDVGRLNATTGVSNHWIDRAIVELRAGRLLPKVGICDRNCNVVPAGSRRYAWLDGYFQDHWSEGEIWSVVEDIGRVLLVPESPSTGRVDFAVHVRGGDLLRDAKLGVLSPTWYAAQLTEMHSRSPLDLVHVITDDFTYAEVVASEVCSKLRSVRINVVKGGNAISDFNVLRCAKRRLIGNSTFGIWASALDRLHAPTRGAAVFGVGRPRQWRMPWETLV
jgi:hypothetical protein